VVDDYLMQITEVVRGEDLLVSSARQCLLFDALGWGRPSFYHCKLLLDADGNKLSKSARTLPRLFSTS
jgi:glutamyl-tRNA synthetase